MQNRFLLLLLLHDSGKTDDSHIFDVIAFADAKLVRGRPVEELDADKDL